jgi:hypothetical protein
VTQQADLVALTAIGAGALFLYAGLKGKSIPDAIGSVVLGRSPATAAPAAQITGSLTAAQQQALAGSLGETTQVPGITTGGMSTGELKALWILAGGSPSTAAVAACIASHESSGDASVTSPNPDGGTNVGLWQLDTPGGVGAGYTVDQLKDPLLNARVAVKGSANGTNWSDWATAPLCGV